MCTSLNSLRQNCSNSSMNKMRLLVLPKLQLRCCSNPFNSTAVAVIQFNQSEWSGYRVHHHGKICSTIFSEIIDNICLIRHLSSFKTHTLGVNSPESSVTQSGIAKGVNDTCFWTRWGAFDSQREGWSRMFYADLIPCDI